LALPILQNSLQEIEIERREAEKAIKGDAQNLRGTLIPVLERTYGKSRRD
jgi:hypothetical protein